MVSRPPLATRNHHPEVTCTTHRALLGTGIGMRPGRVIRLPVKLRHGQVCCVTVGRLSFGAVKQEREGKVEPRRLRLTAARASTTDIYITRLCRPDGYRSALGQANFVLLGSRRLRVYPHDCQLERRKWGIALLLLLLSLSDLTPIR